jgi:hypothetical protein
VRSNTRGRRARTVPLDDLVRLLCPHDRPACGACRLRIVTLFPMVRRRILAERQQALAVFALRMAA